MKRILKQLIYSSIYLLAFGLIAFSVYKANIPKPTCFDSVKNQEEENIDCGGSCRECGPASPEIAVEETEFFFAGEGKTNFAARISNPSSDYWTALTVYEFRIYNRFGFRIFSFSGTVSLGPAEEKYVFISAAPVAYEDVREVDFSVKKTNWEKAESFSRLVHPEDVKTAVSATGAEVSGYVANDSGLSLAEVVIGAFFFDDRGKLLNFSSTRLENMTPFSRRGFSVYLPEKFLGENFDKEAVKIFIETNDRNF